MAETDWLGSKVGSHPLLFCVHQMNRVNCDALIVLSCYLLLSLHVGNFLGTEKAVLLCD